MMFLNSPWPRSYAGTRRPAKATSAHDIAAPWDGPVSLRWPYPYDASGKICRDAATDGLAAKPRRNSVDALRMVVGKLDELSAGYKPFRHLAPPEGAA